MSQEVNDPVQGVPDSAPTYNPWHSYPRSTHSNLLIIKGHPYSSRSPTDLRSTGRALPFAPRCSILT